MSQLLFQWLAISERLGIPSIVVLLCALLVAAIVIVGVVELWRSRRLRPMDAYAFTVLTLIMFMAERAQTRYILPLAPLLANYLLIGLKISIDFLSAIIFKRKIAMVYDIVVASWCLALGLMQVQLIAYGKSIHGGLSAFVSRSATSFYRGTWNDLYEACQWIVLSSDHPGDVGTTAGMNHYVHGFTGRHVPDKLALGMDLGFLIEFDSDPLDPALRGNMKVIDERKFGTMTVYKLRS